MNLKEAYRYVNFLDDLLEQAYEMLGNREFVTAVEQRHIRSRTVREAEDEILYSQPPYDEDINPEDIIGLVMTVLEEKEALMQAIAEAKLRSPLNIDEAVAMNRKKREFIRVLEALTQVKTCIRDMEGRGYRLNVEGEQVPYVYEIQEITTVRFRRDAVREIIRRYRKETEEASKKLDRIEILTEVDYTARWDINDDIGDVLEEMERKRWDEEAYVIPSLEALEQDLLT